MKYLFFALALLGFGMAAQAESPKKSAQQQDWLNDYQYGEASSSGTQQGK